MSQTHISDTPDYTISALKTANNTQSEKTTTQPTDSKKKTAKSPASPSLKGNVKPADSHSTSAVDESLTSFVGMHTLSAASKVICLCSLQISKKQPFIYINELNSHEVTTRFKIPKLIITLLQNGRGFAGKQTLIKEYSLFAKANVSAKESAELINKVNIYIRDLLYQTKQAPGPINRCVSDIGSLHCALETPLQGLELVETAILGACPEHASKLCVCLTVGTNEIFDPDKMKYEIATGITKTGEELIEIYTELLTKYPRVTILQDPFHKKDGLHWYKLHNKIGKTCILSNTITANDMNILANPPSILTDDSADTARSTTTNTFDQNLILMPVNFFKYENTFTITDFLKTLEKTKNKNLLNGMASSLNETNDSFMTDLAVGSQVEFMKVGGFFRSERVQKINRLIEIEKYLMENDMLSTDVDVELSNQMTTIEVPISEKYTKMLQQSEESKTLKKK